MTAISGNGVAVFLVLLGSANRAKRDIRTEIRIAGNFSTRLPNPAESHASGQP